MYGAAGNPPCHPLARVFSAPARPRVQNPVQAGVDRPKPLGMTRLRTCCECRYARVWTGAAVQMHQVVHVTRRRALMRVHAYSFYQKICGFLNNASLLRMLRNVGDFWLLGLAGLRLLATGENTGTPPVKSNPLGQPVISTSRPHLLQIMNNLPS